MEEREGPPALNSTNFSVWVAFFTAAVSKHVGAKYVLNMVIPDGETDDQNRYDKSSSSHEKRNFQPGAHCEESEQYKRSRGREEDDDYYSPVTETSLVEYIPPSAATRPAWFGPVTSIIRTSRGRCVEKDRSGANQVYEVWGSTVEENNF